jgi:hypothetical protein
VLVTPKNTVSEIHFGEESFRKESDVLSAELAVLSVCRFIMKASECVRKCT